MTPSVLVTLRVKLLYSKKIRWNLFVQDKDVEFVMQNLLKLRGQFGNLRGPKLSLQLHSFGGPFTLLLATEDALDLNKLQSRCEEAGVDLCIRSNFFLSRILL